LRLNSIRWRLPIAFLGIAGFTVLLLGVVLFLLLKTYYSDLEQSYLRGASLAIPRGILDNLKSEDPQAELQAYFENVAFLSQTRILITDAEGETIVDTGSPTSYNVGLGIRTEFPELLDQEERRIIEPYIIIQEGSNGQERLSLESDLLENSGTRLAESPERSIEPTESVQGEEEENIIADDITQIPTIDDKEQALLNTLPIYSTDFGIGFNGEDASLQVRSSETLQIEIHDPTGKLATIEFSEGPAYGRTVLSSVAIGFLIAGSLAMIVGAYAGWWVSQRFSSPLLSLAQSTEAMAQGEYSTRVKIYRKDEFGVLARTFNRMAEQVENSIHALQRFVSDAAHELNTPLTALRTNLELMRGEKDQELQRSYVEHAVQQTKRLEELTASLLDLSKLESGSFDERENQIYLTALIREESERFASTAEQKGLEFSFELPDHEIQWMGRPSQIRRVVNNLLDNAIKFTPARGSVKIGLMLEASNILLWIEDTGIGIPESEIPHLFQRFHRAPNASSYPGSGLGLAIVRTIVQAHHGTVSVKNKEQGVKFCIRFQRNAT